jgi:hypothetical protein
MRVADAPKYDDGNLFWCAGGSVFSTTVGGEGEEKGCLLVLEPVDGQETWLFFKYAGNLASH